MQHLPWLDVELFLALARARSLRAAGEALGMDVATVSRRLTALEARAGAQLFDRSRSGIRPTPLGQTLVEAAEAMERAAHDFGRGIEGFERDIAGDVRISVPPAVGDLFLPELVAGLAEAHPRLRVVLEVSTELADIERRRADLAVRVVRPLDGALTTRLLARLPQRALAHPELAARLGAVRAWDDVPWVLPETGAVARAVGALVRRRPLVTTASVPAQLAMVRGGLGVAVLPRFFAARFGLVPLRLDRRLSEPAWFAPELWLVGHAAQRRVPRIAAAARWLAERIPRLAGGR